LYFAKKPDSSYAMERRQSIAYVPCPAFHSAPLEAGERGFACSSPTQKSLAILLGMLF
jgi:hypothetical protein